MAALHTTPDSPAAQRERAEDRSECDPNREEEEEEEKGEEVEELADEEVMVVEAEEDEAVAEVAEELEVEGVQAGPVQQVEVEAEDDDVEDVVAEERSPASGTQEHLSCGGDAQSPGLQEKGKKKELVFGEEVRGGLGGQAGKSSLTRRGAAGVAGPRFFSFLKKLISLIYFYFWLRWVFVAARRLSLVVASRGCSSLRCVGFSLRWLLLLRSTGSRHVGFSSCGTQAQ